MKQPRRPDTSFGGNERAIRVVSSMFRARRRRAAISDEIAEALGRRRVDDPLGSPDSSGPDPQKVRAASSEREQLGIDAASRVREATPRRSRTAFRQLIPDVEHPIDSPTTPTTGDAAI